MNSAFKLFMFGVLFLLVLYNFGGCGKDSSIYEENKSLKMQLNKCEEEIGRLSKQNDELKGKIRALEADLGAFRGMEDGLEKHQRLASELKAELEAEKVSLDDIRVGALGELVLDEVIFNPGNAEISAKGRDVLLGVASVLKDREEQIRVDGHTDSDPIVRSKDLWSSNWELSAVRATRVAEYLEKYGVAPERISVGAFGGTRPVASNDSPSGKKANRRVEILLYDELGKPASE